MALALMGPSAAYADDPSPPASTPVATLVAGGTSEDELTVRIAGSGLIDRLRVAGVELDAAGSGGTESDHPVRSAVAAEDRRRDAEDGWRYAEGRRRAAGDAGPAARGDEERSMAGRRRRGLYVGIDHSVAALAGCVLPTSAGCAGAGPAPLGVDMLPLGLGLPAGSGPADGGVQAPGCRDAACSTPASTGTAPAVAPLPVAPMAVDSLNGVLLPGCALGVLAPGQECGAPPAPAVDPAPLTAGAGQAPTSPLRTPAPVQSTVSGGPALAPTGMSIVAALAGLLLLVIGCLMTWARARE
ncbi:MAG TPA: hypothetical protein VGO86_18365 [Candidatus Dormibacteraeota bacterium]